MRRRDTGMNVKSLCRFLAYVLGRRPDEFGLVPSDDGKVTVKELLQALHEEQGWGHVRQGQLNELMMDAGRGIFELGEGKMAAAERHFADPAPAESEMIPKLLFTPVRPRAHPVVMEKGIKGPEGRWIVLTPSRAMALRIGRRRDREPVVLEINTGSAGTLGVSFFRFGDLFLARSLPPECVIGPPAPPRPDISEKGKAQKAGTPGLRPPAAAPGSFTLTPERDPDRRRALKGRKPKGWKEKARAVRKRNR